MKKQNQQYLRDLLRAWMDNPVGQNPAPVPLPADVDPSVICHLLEAHHVEVALGAHLPLDFHSEQFRRATVAATHRTSFLMMELERILPAITWEECQPVVLKGAALATTLYADPLHRWFLDLDVLVPRSQLDQVCRRLAEKGYRKHQGIRGPLFYERHHFHRIMNGPQGSVLEVHWGLTTPHSVYGFDVEGVFERARPARLGKIDFRVSAPVDQVLHGVYQNIADGYRDLRRVMDMALLMERLQKEDWLYLMKESRRVHMGPAFATWLHVVKNLLDKEPPCPIPEDLVPSWMTRRTLAGLDVSGGLLGRAADTVDGYAYLLHLLLTPSAAKRLREVKRQLFPGEEIFMDGGHAAGVRPPLPRRVRLSLYHLKRLLISGARAFRALLQGSF